MRVAGSVIPDVGRIHGSSSVQTRAPKAGGTRTAFGRLIGWPRTVPGDNGDGNRRGTVEDKLPHRLIPRRGEQIRAPKNATWSL